MKSAGKIMFWLAAIAVLVLLPAKGGKIFDAIIAKFTTEPYIQVEPDALPQPAAPAAKVVPVTANAAEEAKELYVRGLKYFQENNYNKAREEWLQAEKLDPNNLDVRTGLKRLDQLSVENNPE